MEDVSRPFYARRQGEIGVYLDIYEAKPVDPKSFGSRQFFLMSVIEQLYEYLQDDDLVKIKGKLHSQGAFSDAILEEFKPGVVMVVSFNNVDGLNALWNLQKQEKLSVLMQKILVNDQMLKALMVNKIQLRARLWPDEYKACEKELQFKLLKRTPLIEKDRKLLCRVRDYQKQLGSSIQDICEDEEELERSTGTFTLELKRILPYSVIKIKNLNELQKYVKGKPNHRVKTLTSYLASMAKLQSLYCEIESSVCHPMLMVHASSENLQQRTAKSKIVSSCAETSRLLEENSSLEVMHRKWTARLLPLEQPLFLGLLSILSIGLQKAVDIDHTIDEYMTEFPDTVTMKPI